MRLQGHTSKLIAAFVFVYVWTLTTHGKFSVSGDEPHYLIVAHSLAVDRDLDVANNYTNNDARLFGHDHLPMGRHASVDRFGQTESVHDIGLPVLLAVPYLAARSIADLVPPAWLSRFRMDRGLFTYSLISLALAALTAWGVGLMASSVAVSPGSLAKACFVALVGISPPIASHAFLIFPEVVALFLTAVVVWLVESRREVSSAALLWLFGALGFLPWVHRKYSLYVLGLAFVIVWVRRDFTARLERSTKYLAGCCFVIPQLALHGWTYFRWANLGGPQMLSGVPFSASTWMTGLVGLWLDRQSGVLAYGPIYWLIVPCWILTWRRTWPYVVPALLLYLPMAAFAEWWGGFSPAGRYLVPIIPLCAMAIVAALERKSIQLLALALAIPQIFIDAVVWQHPRLLWPVADAINPALNSLGALGASYGKLLPMLRVGLD